jgi:hypothetical protein
MALPGPGGGRAAHAASQPLSGRKFYESIKAATGLGTVARIFMTGVSPVPLDSLTSGFNIGANFSRDAFLAKMMGLTPQEVEAILGRVGVAAALAGPQRGPTFVARSIPIDRPQRGPTFVDRSIPIDRPQRGRT